MTDRTSIITGSQAAKAFPQLAKFLAESTSLAPDVAEQALRAAAGDDVDAQEAAAHQAMWKRAVDNANASIGVPPEQAPAAAEKPAHPWGDVVRNANASIGAV
jgi:hypothetical protein